MKAQPPASPTSISGMPNTALSDASMMSQADIRPKPAPSAAPLTAAITGFLHSRIAFEYSRAPRLWRQ
ncbi:hypothetical protein D3C83_173930 [compost metagenome]